MGFCLYNSPAVPCSTRHYTKLNIHPCAWSCPLQTGSGFFEGVSSSSKAVCWQSTAQHCQQPGHQDLVLFYGQCFDLPVSPFGELKWCWKAVWFGILSKVFLSKFPFLLPVLGIKTENEESKVILGGSNKLNQHSDSGSSASSCL